MVLVTGASGFVGSHLVRYLSEKGHTVRALYNSRPPTDNLKHLRGVAWQQCDLLDIYDVEDAVVGVTHIYHCAAIISFDTSDRDKLLHFNVESTANIVNEALEQNVQRLVLISSVAALGASAEAGGEITEEEQWEESTHSSVYGLSKHLAEMEVWRGVGEGLSAAIINPATILGSGDWEKGSARLMKVVDREFPFYTEGITGWVDVADVVAAAYMLMQSDVEAERFILSAGNFSYKEVFTKMAEALGRKPPHIKAGAFMAGLVWRWNALRKMLFNHTVTVTRETALTARKRRHYNNEKFVKQFPDFTYTPLDQSITRMAKDYVKKGP